MMMQVWVKSVCVIVIVCYLSSGLFAQMEIGGDTFYGNEWIDYDQTYYKALVAEDGIYRISYQTLLQSGIPVDVIPAEQFRLYHEGKQVPIHLSTNGLLGSNDYIEFYGEKNRSSIDRHLFKDPEQDMLNPEYSLVTDSSAYFLTWSATGESPTRLTTIQNDLTNLPQKEPWYWAEMSQVYQNELTKFANVSGVKKSHFQVGEGYSTGFEKSHNFTLNPTHIVATGDSARLSVRFAVNERPHQLRVAIDGQVRLTDAFYGYELRNPDFGVMLEGPNDKVDLSLSGDPDKNDRQAVSLVSLTYPRAFEFDNQSIAAFAISANGQRKYLELAGFNANSNNLPIVYLLNTGQRLITTYANNLVQIALPAQTDDYKLFVANPSSIKSVTDLQPLQYENYDNQQGDFIIISNPRLYQDATGRNLVQEYADYKASSAGGSFNPVIVDINQLYDQFAYGLNRHYIAIRNFGHYIKKNWSNPRYVFLLGKGLETDQIRTPDRVAQYQDNIFLIPTFGNPGSDNLLLSDNEHSAPAIPIGRLAASSPRDIDIYLRKLKAFDENRNLPQTIEDKYWMKKVLHLGGGDPLIQSTIRNNLEYIERIIENSTYGAEVSAFYKQSVDAIEVSRSEQLFELIRNGVSMITFFGHSGANSFDFALDSPDNYDNQDKYPVFVSLGCYSGQIHNTFLGVSESFVFSEDRGGIAFLASTGLGYVSSLRLASEFLYESIGDVNYGQGIGDATKSLIRGLDTISFLGVEELAGQFTLHGDPSIRLNTHDGADYLVDGTSVRFDPPIIDIQRDSFKMLFDLVNLGSKEADSIDLKISQTLPNEITIDILDTTVVAPSSYRSVELIIPTLKENAVGLNTINVTVDPNNEISELPVPYAEQNNNLLLKDGSQGIKVSFTDNSVQPVYPKDFAIVPNSDLTLYASTTNAFAPDTEYRIELDTTLKFNSQWKRDHILQQRGGVLSWQPNIELSEGQVYYWRISEDSTQQNLGYQWKSSSFVYLPGSEEGWNQSHYEQYGQNDLDFLNIDQEKGGLRYRRGFSTLIFESGIGRGKNVWNWEGAKWNSPWNTDMGASITVVALSALTGGDWIENLPERSFGSNFNANTPGYFRYDFTTEESRKGFIDLLEFIPEDYYIIVYAFLKDNESSYNPELWRIDEGTFGKSVSSALEKLGAKRIMELERIGSMPYFFAARKGKDGESQVVSELIGDNSSKDIPPTPISFEYLVGEGNMVSQEIGPASRWERLEWSTSLSGQDSVYIKVFGKKEGADEFNELYAETLSEHSIDLSEISASLFPYLRLELNTFDTKNRTTPQLDWWKVLFKGLPDAAINPSDHFAFTQDTIEAGRPFKMGVSIQNTSNYDLDSLLVNFAINDEQNDVINKHIRFAPLLAHQSFIAELDFETNELSGAQTLRIQANPNNDQLELWKFNNTAEYSFFVTSDRKNPVIDVTFDGLHIMEGDIISPNPTIGIQITDENSFFLLNNRANIDVALKHPNGQIEDLNDDLNGVRFTPAQEGQANQANLEIDYNFEQNGIYELIVQGRDNAGNQAGMFDYKISFQVVLEKTISNVLPYPNPFSTSTQFVYTLTGLAPSSFSIQIMTVSGRIVKTIQLDQKELLKIGTHRTEYRWDGTDDYGDQLANGIYLYRVMVKDTEGNPYKISNDPRFDGFFKEQFGKLVILR